MFVWLKVTPDRYELPVAVADTGKELARICGVSENNVYNTMTKARKLGHRCKYIRVEVEEDKNDNVIK